MKTIKVKNEEELESMIDREDFNISKAIVDSIMENINTTKSNILVVSFELEEENEIQDVFCDRENFAQTLEENLHHYEKLEMYEECQKILDTINYLKK